MDMIEQYIGANYAIIVAVLYVIGIVLKKTPRIPNNFIPFIITTLGMGFAILSALSRSSEYANMAALLYDSIVQGILCAGMSVYIYEVVKQSKKK